MTAVPDRTTFESAVGRQNRPGQIRQAPVHVPGPFLEHG